MNHQAYRTVAWAVFFALISLLLTWPPPTQAGPELPPREAPAPAHPPSEDDGQDGDLIGAHIVLHILSDPDAGHGTVSGVQGAPNGVWTVVQWQDSADGWHDVDGWQGAPDEKDQKTWWLAPELFGKGPFRWLVYQGFSPGLIRSPDQDPGGDRLMATSEPFYLSNSPSEVLHIQVSLPE